LQQKISEGLNFSPSGYFPSHCRPDKPVVGYSVTRRGSALRTSDNAASQGKSPPEVTQESFLKVNRSVKNQTKKQ